VDAIVEGTVLRNGGRVRITAQLIDGQTDRHLWAEEYERGAQDVLAMQSDITRDIASSVNARLTAGERVALARPRSVDPEVEDLYWKGVYYINKTTVPIFSVRAIISNVCFRRTRKMPAPGPASQCPICIWALGAIFRAFLSPKLLP
jgi:hypothetical protein